MISKIELIPQVDDLLLVNFIAVETCLNVYLFDRFRQTPSSAARMKQS